MSAMFHAPFNQHPAKSDFFFCQTVCKPEFSFANHFRNMQMQLLLQFHLFPAISLLSSRKELFLKRNVKLYLPKIPSFAAVTMQRFRTKVYRIRSVTNGIPRKQSAWILVQHKCGIFILSAGCGCCHLKPFGPTRLFPPAASHIIIIHRQAAAELCDTTDRTRSFNDHRPPSTS